MEISGVKRIDHLGLVMGVIKEFGIIEFISNRLSNHDLNTISSGEAICAMLLNGLGFTSQPLSLTPHFFESKALDILFDRPINPQDFNRYRLGRVLDKAYEYGIEFLFSEIALHICEKISLNDRFISIDTTSFSVSGSYDEASDEHAITLTHGYSKDHRPDLKQGILELITSHDGGIPLMMKCFDGNESDSKIFKKRCEAFTKSLKDASFPKFLVGDSKLYHDDNADYLSKLNFITRVPGTYALEKKVISEAIRENHWHAVDDDNRYYEKEVIHLEIKQRWLVVFSDAASSRAVTTVNRIIEKEYASTEKALMHLRNKEFACEQDALKNLEELSNTFKYHDIIYDKIDVHDYYEGKGRPKKNAKPIGQKYKIFGKILCLPERRQNEIVQRSCYVIATNADQAELTNLEAIEAYKDQNASIERGFRFLKDPVFFTSSFFLKKTSRIMGLLMIMSLSLLIYSVAQRHVRHRLIEENETLPNQINQPIQNPTMRWIFQCLCGIDVVYTKTNETEHLMIMGLTPLKEKILRLFPKPVLEIYRLIPKNYNST